MKTPVRELLMLSLTAAMVGAQADVPNQTFPDGVASGEVTPYSAILWTRASRSATLDVEVAADDNFRRIVFRREARAAAENDLTVKIGVDGLRPDTVYHYRWRDGTGVSPVGRFRTAPDRWTPAGVRFVFAGDSDGTFRNGAPAFNRFEVLDAARQEKPDFFIYLGDTIYADSLQHPAPASALDEYRAAYRGNRSYRALQELLRSTSTYAIWDDHEIRDDWTPATVDATQFAAGRKAFLDYMPLGESRMPQDPECMGRPMFRLFRWGSEVLLIILDGRSCRSESASQACGADLAPALPEPLRRLGNLPASVPAGCLDKISSPERTMLGPSQKALLKLVLEYVPAKFKFVINPVPMQRLLAVPYDRWEGYAAERAEILNFLRDRRIPNVVFLTTDLHATVTGDLFLDDARPIASEVIAGPIATTTLEKELLAFPGFSPFAFSQLSALLGLECTNLSAFAYGLVEADPFTGVATITAKDDQGRTLCMKTVGNR